MARTAIGALAVAILVTVAAACGGRAAAPTARVPKVGADELLTMDEAYDRIRAAGLRPEIRAGFDLGLHSLPLAAAPRPAPGTMVVPGSVVSFVAGGGPHVDPGRYDAPASMLLPDLRGMSAAAFFVWARDHAAGWGARVAPLPAGSRPHLWDNYRVARQDPPPGTRLTLDEDSGFLDPAVVVGLEPVS
jgi:hypothetical protein